MTDLYDELKQDLEQKRLEALWQKYRWAVFAGVAAILAAVSGWQIWAYTDRQARNAASDAYLAAGDLFAKGPGSEKAALEAFQKLAQSGSPGYRWAAKMNEAALHIIGGRNAQAVEIYDTLIADGAGSAEMTDYLRYRSALLLADAATPADLRARVEPVASGGSPWAPLAKELLAYANWRGGDLAAAKREYELLANDLEAPEGLRLRAKNMVELLTLGVKPSGVAPAPAAAVAVDPEADLLPVPLTAPAIPEGQ
jgi:hypothetical protein